MEPTILPDADQQGPDGIDYVLTRSLLRGDQPLLAKGHQDDNAHIFGAVIRIFPEGDVAIFGFDGVLYITHKSRVNIFGPQAFPN